MKITKRLLEAARAEAQVADAELLRRLRDMIIERHGGDVDVRPWLDEAVTWQALRDVLLAAVGDVERATPPRVVGFDRPWWDELAATLDDVELRVGSPIAPADAAAAVRVLGRAVRQVGQRLGAAYPYQDGFVPLDAPADHAVGLRLTRVLDDLRECGELLDEHLKRHEFRARLEQWEPDLGISRAEFARRAFADDPTLTPTEYGRLIEQADQDDLAAMLDAEREQARSFAVESHDEVSS